MTTAKTVNRHFVRSDTPEDSAAPLANVTPFPRSADAEVDVPSGAEGAQVTRGWPIKAAIAALVSAIDGTYGDEAAAVRLAVIKALKAVA